MEKCDEIVLMTPDWSRVTLEDVRRACQIYDSGAARPKRPARSTFLLLNAKTYPAKFIRGLAYSLATGVELTRIRITPGERRRSGSSGASAWPRSMIRLPSQQHRR